MFSEPAIEIQNLGKCYQIYDKPRDRLLQMLLRRRKILYREFWALRSLDLQVRRGEVVGVIGVNGSGKSTLLQLVCGTLMPTCGDVKVSGRVAALLELGAGFNPEFSGRENIFLSAAVTGMRTEEINKRYNDIVDFSGINDFIDQPVKTYSSGMYVRLAFAIAIHVDPDILIIDEALSVGDGVFSRKSFDRIMAMKEAGKTILFCSHSLYQVEAFCDRVLWLDKGNCIMVDNPAIVISRYNAFLLDNRVIINPTDEPAVAEAGDSSTDGKESPEKSPDTSNEGISISEVKGQGKIISAKVVMDGADGRRFSGNTGKSNLTVRISYYVDAALPDPTIGVTIDYERTVAACSAVSRTDQVRMTRDEHGFGQVELCFPELNLRKGEYWVSVYLGCENALHYYDMAERIAVFSMRDPNPEPGLFCLPHRWNKNLASDKDKASSELTLLEWGHRIHTDAADSLGLRHQSGQFEHAETQVCKRLIKPGDSILDIGANIGYYSLLCAHLASPGGRVLALEPDPANYDLLSRNVRCNQLEGIITTKQVAAGEKNATGFLYHAPNAGMHRLYPSVCCSDEGVSVSVIKGDTLNLAPLDFLKIDIEGYEPGAFMGLENTLKSSPRLKILCEFSPLSIWEAGFSPVEMLSFMQQRGFCLLTLADNGQWKMTAFQEIMTELEKISTDDVLSFAASIKNAQLDAESMFTFCRKFLSERGYSREVFENILLTAPEVSREVVKLLEM